MNSHFRVSHSLTISRLIIVLVFVGCGSACAGCCCYGYRRHRRRVYIPITTAVPAATTGTNTDRVTGLMISAICIDNHTVPRLFFLAYNFYSLRYWAQLKVQTQCVIINSEFVDSFACLYRFTLLNYLKDTDG